MSKPIDEREAYWRNHKSRRNLIIVGEDLELVWDEEMAIEAREMWREGYTILEISDRVGRHEYDTAVLLLELLIQKKIKPRPEGFHIEPRK